MLCHRCYQLEEECLHFNTEERLISIAPNLKEETYIVIDANLKEEEEDLK